VTYEVPAPGSIVSLRIYDAAGRWVQTIEEGFVGGGLRTATWDGTNRNGERVASGVYFCRLGTPAGTHTRKMVLLK
jgi:flagellar hook assembly protein FlgD